jgi:hypothetical protein
MEMKVPMIDEQILSQLWPLFLTHTPVRLLNVFHGVPISYEATISMISQTYLGLSVHHYQAVCIALEKNTYLQSERLPHSIRAHSVTVDIREQEVLLDQLVQPLDDLGNRISLRVQPKEAIFIEIHKNGYKHVARLADLSLQGMDKFTCGILGEHEFNLRQNQEVELSLKLPGADSPVCICGVAGRHSFDQQKNLHRLKIQLSPDSSSEPVLADYISQRQAEIMQELELLYMSMRKPRL